MNHYDPFIQDFLAQYKSVSFDKIGHLTITREASSSASSLQSESVMFQYDKKAITTPELITFIAERTGKNKVLIEADLESYFELTRQFINIGKSYELERIGFISLNKSGEFSFTQYDTAEGREEHRAAKKKQYSYATIPAKQKRSSRSFLAFIAFLIIVCVLGVIGWGTYKLFVGRGIKNINDTLVVNRTALPSTDTSLKRDSTNYTAPVVKNDSIEILKSDSSEYKFIFGGTYFQGRAKNRTDELKIVLSEDVSFDSVRTDSAILYRLYLKLRLPSADTAKMKDSLQRYFKHSVKIVPGLS